MNTQGKVSAYTANDVKTANRLHLLIMLYDSALKFMNQALAKLEENNIAGKGEFIGKAMAIISEFKGTLDFKPNRELAENLDRLYTFVIDSLIAANIKNDSARLRNAIRITRTLREGWSDLEKKMQKGGGVELSKAARGMTADSSVRISV